MHIIRTITESVSTKASKVRKSPSFVWKVSLRYSNSNILCNFNIGQGAIYRLKNIKFKRLYPRSQNLIKKRQHHFDIIFKRCIIETCFRLKRETLFLH